MFERFTDEGLAQTSFLIACDRTREAVVVDPRRDGDVYVEAAQRHGLTLAFAIETHIHADFVSGARELAALGARVIGGPAAGLRFPFHEASHRETRRLGDVTLEILHTPGHTPEHISIVVREPNQPARVLTGDTLFVGAVGRPDLLGADQARALASQLHESLFTQLLPLGDDVEVHPGHGAGSLCGSGIGNEPHSTIGQERRFNPLLQLRSAPDFVAAVLNDLPDTPPYFPRMKVINRDGPAVLGLTAGVSAPVPVPPRDAATTIEQGALLIDLRSADAFGAGHPAGAINFGFSARIGYWAGWILAPDSQLLLLGSETQATEARRQLLRVGLDAVGMIDGGFDAWSAAGAPVARLEQISARDLIERRDRERLTVVDVRTAREWRAGHVDRSLNLPLGELPARAGELRGAEPIATICESGYRSSLASSLLLRAGFRVVNVTDGTSAYRALAGC